MSAALATLSIDIEARLARLEEGLDKAVKANQQAAQKVDSAWTAAGATAGGVLAGMAAAVSVSAIKSWVQTNLEAVDSLNDISDATGSTVENISALQDLARRTGTDVRLVDDALVKLNKVLNEAKPGSEQANALEAIGLNAVQLRRLDPAEALRQIAVALSQYANDGNKARLEQILLTKSARELAPFLKDLGEAQKLNATLTKGQAEEAEKLVKELGALKAASAAAAQGLTADLAPALTQALRLFQAFKSGPGIGAGLLEGLKGNQFKSAQEGLNFYASEVTRVQKQIDEMTSGAKPSRTIYGADLMAEAVAERGRLSALASVYRDVLNADGAGGGRGSVNLGDKPKPKLPSLADAVKAAGDGTGNELDQWIKKLEKETQHVAELSQAAQVELAIDAGAFKGQPEARIQYLRDLAAGLDKLKEKSDEITVVIPEEEIQRMKDAFSVLDQTETAQIEKLASLEEALNAAFKAGVISPEQLAEGLGVLDKKFTDLIKPVEEVQEQMSKFAEQAQRNIQDALGSSLKSALRGNFKDIGDLWANLLTDMAAQAVAARLNESLFGKSGIGTTAVNSLMSFFGLANGGAFNKGLQFYANGDVFSSPTMFGHAGGLGVLGEAGPEAVLPLARGQGGKLGVRAQGGGGVNIVQYVTNYGGNRNELMLGMKAAKDAAVAEISDLLRRRGSL